MSRFFGYSEVIEHLLLDCADKAPFCGFNKHSIAPRVGLGIAGKHVELELHGLYEIGNGVVNRTYVEENADYMNVLDPAVVNKQFKSKIHGGLTLRVLFGK